MKKTALFLIMAALAVMLAPKARAQTYKAAAGLKFGGYENGVSGKYFFKNNTAIEGILGIRSHGVVITGLYEIHQTAFDVPELKFYYGGGAHLGAIGDGYYRRYGGDDEYYNSGILLGADGVLGLEYVIPKSPIAISVDLNPRLEIARGPFFDLAPGLGLKYTF